MEPASESTVSEQAETQRCMPNSSNPLPRELVLLIRTKNKLRRQLKRDLNNKELYLQFKALEKNIKSLVKYLKSVPPQSESGVDFSSDEWRLRFLNNVPPGNDDNIDFTSDDWM